MLFTIFVLLLVMWLLGIISSYTFGGAGRSETRLGQPSRTHGLVSHHGRHRSRLFADEARQR